MKIYTIKTIFALKEDKNTKILGTCRFDEYDENFFEFVYHHVLTGQRCETLNQVFGGWSEQDKEEQQKWQLLQNRIENFKDFDQHLYHDVNDKPKEFYFVL